MKHDPFNHRLLDEFPNLKDTYQSIKGGVFDLDTPSYYFYEAVFTPYFEEMIKNNNQEEINHCIKFVEELLNDENEMSSRIATQSILCPMYEDGIDLAALPLLEKSKSYYQEWLAIQN